MGNDIMWYNDRNQPHGDDIGGDDHVRDHQNSDDMRSDNMQSDEIRMTIKGVSTFFGLII